MIERHRTVLEMTLEPGERLLDAGGVIATGRRRRRGHVPRRGFVLVVTDRRLIAAAASTWLARPTGEVLVSWAYESGAALTAGRFGRLHLLLPDRSVVSLAPFGTWSVRHLASAV